MKRRPATILCLAALTFGLTAGMAVAATPEIGAQYWWKKPPLCVDDYKVIDDLSDAAAKNDNEGFSELLQQHQMSVPSGTHVRILNVDVWRNDVDVRVTSTDSPLYGERIFCMLPHADTGNALVRIQ